MVNTTLAPSTAATSRMTSPCTPSRSPMAITRLLRRSTADQAITLAPGQGRVQLGMWHERLAQLGRCLQPIGAVWQKHTTTAHGIHLWVIHPRWCHRCSREGVRGAKESAPHANGHDVAGAEPLLRAIVNGAHRLRYCLVLLVDSGDSGVVLAAPLLAAIDQVIIRRGLHQPESP